MSYPREVLEDRLSLDITYVDSLLAAINKEGVKQPRDEVIINTIIEIREIEMFLDAVWTR